MKNLFSVFLISMLFSSCFQKPLKNLQETAQKLEPSSGWDIEKSKNGTLMILNTPYKHCDSCDAEYLTLSVAKIELEKRPRWISVTLPCNDNPQELTLANPKFVLFVFLKNLGKDTLQWENDLTGNELPGFYVESCKDQTYTYRMMAGYGKELYGKNSVDVFQRLQEFDQANFYIYSSDGTETVVKVPLLSFQEQYQKLK